MHAVSFVATTGRIELGTAGGDEALDQLTIHVEQAAGRDAVGRKTLLPPRAIEQVAGLEHGGLGGVVVEDGSRLHVLLVSTGFVSSLPGRPRGMGHSKR